MNMTEDMESVVSLFSDEWWVNSTTLARSKKYWILYKPKADGEDRMRLALIDGATTYFATSGFAPPDRYRKVPLAEQRAGSGTFLRRMR